MCKLRFGQMTPLVAAATLASPPVLAALLDAGADMRKDAAYVFGEDACHMRGCVIAGRVENARYLLTRFPEYVSSVPSFAGFCPLNFAFEAGFNQHAMVETPLEPNPNPRHPSPSPSPHPSPNSHPHPHRNPNPHP